MNKIDYLKFPSHRVDCGWCRKVLVPGPEPISDGICIYCREDVLKELKELKTKKEPTRNENQLSV